MDRAKHMRLTAGFTMVLLTWGPGGATLYALRIVFYFNGVLGDCLSFVALLFTIFVYSQYKSPRIVECRFGLIKTGGLCTWSVTDWLRFFSLFFFVFSFLFACYGWKDYCWRKGMEYRKRLYSNMPPLFVSNMANKGGGR
jgi:hypothetical protein